MNKLVSAAKYANAVLMHLYPVPYYKCYAYLKPCAYFYVLYKATLLGYFQGILIQFMRKWYYCSKVDTSKYQFISETFAWLHKIVCACVVATDSHGSQ